jgi:galactose mutarotase-like enzyme
MLTPRNRNHLLASIFVLLILFGWYKNSSSSPIAFAAAIVVASGGKQSTSETDPASPPNSLQIGGQQVVRLERKPTSGATKPEFLSATILPGRGMNLFRITAHQPGKGTIEVFASPSLEEAAQILNAESQDEHGVKGFTFGGAFIAPYANRVRGKLSADRKTIATQWNGKTLTLPAVWKGKAPDAELHAIHGLILDRKADILNVKTTPDGQTVTGKIHAGNFGGYWRSKTDLTISVALTGPAVEATITAKNVGNESEPMGIGWHPYFNIPSGDRKQARLHIPASQLAEVNNYDDVFPTGNLVEVKGTKYDFTPSAGNLLGDTFLDDNFSHLTREGGNLVVDLIDPASSYGIRIRGLSPQLKTVQVYAPPDKPFAAIEEQFNFADPFSSVWKSMDTGMITLRPGQSVTWKVRLELFTPDKQSDVGTGSE